jgi:hypothetical protein
MRGSFGNRWSDGIASNSTIARPAPAHYSGAGHRPDMVARAQDQNGQHYAVFDTPLVD